MHIRNELYFRVYSARLLMPKKRKHSEQASSSSSWTALPYHLFSRAAPERFLMCRLHRVEADADEVAVDASRVFIAAIPSGIIEEEFVNFLVDAIGPVEQVAMHGSRTSALVCFQSPDAVRRLLNNLTKKRKKPPVLHRMERTEAYGLKGWVAQHKAQYNQNTNATLQKQLDEWIDAYEEREARQKEEAMQALEEDGWTVVRRFKGRKKNANEADGITVGAVAPAAARDIASRSQQKVAKRSEGQGTDFYRSNTREKRRSELIDLREKFEEDRRRLSQLRQARAGLL